MPKPSSPEILSDLQAACAGLSHLGAQFQVDVCQLEHLGLKWVAAKFRTWADANSSNLCVFINRILYYGEDPQFDSGSVDGANSVEEVLDRAHTLVSGVHDQLVEYCKRSGDTYLDSTCSLYGEAIECLEGQLNCIERELTLVSLLGEPGYIGARLEDS